MRKTDFLKKKIKANPRSSLLVQQQRESFKAALTGAINHHNSVEHLDSVSNPIS